MTFMLSSVRSSDIMQNDENAPRRPGSNKRKPISLLPSSPAKLIRLSRFSSLLSTSLSASSPGRDYDGVPTRKSAPTCTISLENVTVINSCDLRSKAMSMDCDMSPSIPVRSKPQPLHVVDVNVIPFPTESVSESGYESHTPVEQQSSVHGRRRRSNHLLLKPQPASSAKKHRRSHSSTISISKRAPLTPISLADAESTSRASLPPVCRRGDIKFTALLRRSVLVGLVERENHQSHAEFDMEVDEDMDGGSIGGHRRSESVTLDILNEEADATLAYQDHLLVDRLGKYLAECGYREPLWTSTSSFFHHVPSLVTISSPLSIEPRRPASPVLSMVSTSTSPTSSDSESSLDPFVEDPINVPGSPIPPPVPVPSEPIPIPKPTTIRRSSPQRPSSPRSTDPSSKILTPPQLVATLVLRHRDRAAIRPRSSRSFEDAETGMSVSGSYGHMRKRSPLACEAASLQSCEEAS